MEEYIHLFSGVQYCDLVHEYESEAEDAQAGHGSVAQPLSEDRRRCLTKGPKRDF
jgi:hypothetical protein